MIKPVSKIRTLLPVNDFQVFKGQCERTMKPFGQPVTAAHEARLMIQDDRDKLPAGSKAVYAIHRRSENKILQIVTSADRTALPKAA